MTTLDLVNKSNSDIKYEPIKYPDGQRDILIEPFWKDDILQLEYRNGVQIKSRLNNAEDLLMIICATKALKNLKVKEIHLYAPYIMGLRSDRLFKEGGNRYVKDIIAPILNAENFESITCLDAHSFVAENCINNLEVDSNYNLVKFFFENIKMIGLAYSNYVLISPDAGASHKIHKLAEKIGYKGDVITCSKERGVDGKLSNTTVPDFDYSKDMIIIDDIFDFGGTFKNISKAISQKIPESATKIGKKYLIVSHAIQEEGLKDALKYFDDIYTTNSYKDFNLDKVKQLDVF